MPQAEPPVVPCSDALTEEISATGVPPDAPPSGTGGTAALTSQDLHPAPAESAPSTDPLLVQAVEDAPDATGDLIRFIEQRYHHSQRDDLEELLRLAREVAGHRGDGSRASLEMVARLSGTRDLLATQMQQDEFFLFPMILSGARPKLTLLIKRVMAEHQSQLALVEELRDLVESLRAPAAVHAPWSALCLGLKEFEEDLRASVHLKNTVLFPRFL